VLWCSSELTVDRDSSVGTVVTLAAGEQLTVALHWSGSTRILHRTDPVELVDRTAQAWRRWAGRLRYEGPQQASVDHLLRW
jgi:alpha,alpha-trehalase